MVSFSLGCLFVGIWCSYPFRRLLSLPATADLGVPWPTRWSRQLQLVPVQYRRVFAL